MKKLINANRAFTGQKPTRCKYSKKQISEAIQKWTKVLESLDEADGRSAPKFNPVVQTTDSDAVNGKDMYAIQFLYAPEYTCVVCPKANIPSEIEDMAYSILASSEVYDTEENFLASATRAAQLAKKLIASKGRIDLNDGVVLSDDSEDTNIIACPLNEVFDAKFGAPPAYLNIHLPSNGMK